MAGTVAANPTTIEFGEQTSTISPTGVSGGSGDYNYAWYVNSDDTDVCGTGTSSYLGTGPTWTTGSEITGPGTYYYCYVVSDGNLNSQPSGYGSVTSTMPTGLAITPLMGPVGTPVTATGLEFTPGATVSQVDMLLSGGDVPSVPVSCAGGAPVVGATGGFTCTFDVPAVPGGVYLVWADDSVDPVTYATYTFTVTTVLTPTVAVLLTPNTISLLEGTIVSVTVSGSGPTPTGSVSISDGLAGPNDSCTISALDASGSGSCELIPSAEGSLTITATYSGDSNYGPAVGMTRLGVTAEELTMSPTSGSQDETLDVVFGGFTPTSPDLSVSFGSGSDIRIDSVKITGLSSVTVQITINRHAMVQADDVKVRVYSDASPPTLLQRLDFGPFSVTLLTLTMSPTSGSQAETLDVILGGFTPPTAATTVSFGSGSGITVDSVTVSGLSSITVQISIGIFAKVRADDVSVSWTTGTTPPLTHHSLDFGDFQVTLLDLTISPTSGSQDETLNVVLGGFTPSGHDMAVQFGSGGGGGITVDGWTISGLSTLIVQITIGDHAKVQGDVVKVILLPGYDSNKPGHTFLFGMFYVTPLALTMSPTSGSQGETLDVLLGGFTVAPTASDMTITFGGVSSGITVGPVIITGLSSITVQITISGTAPLTTDSVKVVESVSGGTGSATTILFGDFTVVS
ncbi:MAG: Ig-like domain-containing protein [Thermoplasmata archaeon]